MPYLAKKNDKFEFCDPKSPKKHVLISKKNVLHQLEKVDIFVVNVVISW